VQILPPLILFGHANAGVSGAAKAQLQINQQALTSAGLTHQFELLDRWLAVSPWQVFPRLFGKGINRTVIQIWRQLAVA